ncbi:DUF3891 family protein [Maribacter sp. 2307ULW6-5]|uniref:DUF3891 family protein n=1 Tax=Maribacter sp. 2307ULW6-5 TaxID=3386275 RepID=UPI0039BCCB15
MIVRNTNQGWHVVYQAAHGLLAGTIAHHLKREMRPKAWMETWVAVTEHDDHQLDFNEKDYLSQLGTPIDFMENQVPKEKAVERARRIYHRSRAKSAWTALMVYLHLDFLYGDMDHQGMRSFLDSLKETVHPVCDLYGASPEEAKAAYQLVRFCDRLSLILCQEQVPGRGRALEINAALSKKTSIVMELENGDLTVAPWCFERDRVELSVEFRVLRQATFEGNKALQKALGAAKVERKHWALQKAD